MPNIPNPGPAPAIPGTQVTALDIISKALRMINVLASGEVPSGSEASDALATLNQMMDEWNAERLMIFTINRLVFVPLTLKQVYTVGPGGDVNIQRPARIEYYSVLSLNNQAQPLELPLDSLTDQQWQTDVPVKNISATLPTKVYDDGAFPLRNLSYFPIPSAQVNFVYYYWQPLTQFPDLVTPFTFPPAYLKAIHFNLAADLAPEFAAEIPESVAIQAMTTKGKIKLLNAPILQMRCDPGITNKTGGWYNFYSDLPVRR